MSEIDSPVDSTAEENNFIISKWGLNEPVPPPRSWSRWFTLEAINRKHMKKLQHICNGAGIAATHWMPIPLSPTEAVRKANNTNEPDPCYFCGEPAFLETCDHPQCNCGFRWLGCLNDACPVQPHIDNNDIATAEEALAVWNGDKARFIR